MEITGKKGKVTVGSCERSNGDSSVKTGDEKRHLGNNVDRDNCIKKKNKAGGGGKEIIEDPAR